MSRIALVTGAGGFIGRCSVAPLLAKGYTVHAVVGRHARHESPELLEGAVLHEVDLLEPAAAQLVTRIAPTHLLHFAWIATPGVYWTSPDNQRWLSAGEHLLRAFHAAGGRRAVMAGSSAEYDWTRVSDCDERTSPLAHDSPTLTPYAACKLAMGTVLEDFGRNAGLSTAWGRIFFQYGPYEHPDRLASSVIVNLLGGRAALCTHGRQVRSFLHVADVGSAFAALLDSEVEGPVNIGAADGVSLASFLGTIAAQIGRPELLKLGARPAPTGEPPRLVPVVERLSREVGWRPAFGLPDGIADSIAWWRGRLAGAA